MPSSTAMLIAAALHLIREGLQFGDMTAHFARGR